jgi:hypothetical protein
LKKSRDNKQGRIFQIKFNKKFEKVLQKSKPVLPLPSTLKKAFFEFKKSSHWARFQE